MAEAIDRGPAEHVAIAALSVAARDGLPEIAEVAARRSADRALPPDTRQALVGAVAFALRAGHGADAVRSILRAGDDFLISYLCQRLADFRISRPFLADLVAIIDANPWRGEAARAAVEALAAADATLLRERLAADPREEFREAADYALWMAEEPE